MSAPISIQKPGILCKKDKKICVAIDFGTSRTGFAYCFVDDKKKKIVSNLEWEGMEGISYPKTLTKILYKGSTPMAWGFPAEKMMTEVDEDDTSHRLLKYFKMDLIKSSDGFVTDKDAPDGKFKVMEVIVDYLKLFFEKVKQTLDELKVFDMEEIRWCLTIPAIWEDEQKEAMKIVAEKVGLVSSKNDADLMLILEPEAAAVYCLHSMKDEGCPIKEGESFIVVDAGGGTVDLTAHKVIANGKLKEIYGSGGDCGSSELDEHFLNYLTSEVGEYELKRYRKDYPLDMFEFLNSWERTKCSVDDFTAKQTVKMPPSMKDLVKKSKIPTSRGGHIILTQEVQESIFEKTFKKITKLVDEMLEKTGKVDYIFLVGGFGESKALQKRIRSEFEKKIKRKIFIPSSSSEAIVAGAAMMGIEELISVRKMRRGYGVKATIEFDPKVHKKEKKVIKAGKELCSDIYDRFVEIEDEVEISKVIKREYGVIHKDQKCMKLEVYNSMLKGKQYVDDHGVAKMGEIIVDLSDTTGGINRKVSVEFKFGKSVFEFHATNVQNSKVYRADLAFGGKIFEYTGPKFVEDAPSSRYHIIFLNDISGSMSCTDALPTKSFISSRHNNRVGALYEACHAFLEKRKGTNDIVSCLHHHHDTMTVFSYQPTSPDLVNQMLDYHATGGNNFKKAMQGAYDIIAKDKDGSVPIILFMTDGHWNEDGASEVLTDMMKKYGPDGAGTGITLNTICLGKSVNEALMSKFASIGKGTFSKSGMSLIELKAVYESFADALIL